MRRIMDNGSSNIAGKISCPLHKGLVVARYLFEADGVHDRCHMSCGLRADNLEDQGLSKIHTFRTKCVTGINKVYITYALEVRNFENANVPDGTILHRNVFLRTWIRCRLHYDKVLRTLKFRFTVGSFVGDFSAMISLDATIPHQRKSQDSIDPQRVSTGHGRIADSTTWVDRGAKVAI